jgi:L-erythro-3,5-diaminohexanoate dehydrogenase
MSDTFRPGGDALGLQRVVSPRGLLPQAADQVDPSLPPYQSEVWIDVDVLNIDAASFTQLEQVAESGGPGIAQQIEAIVQHRGKMQNPVTGSGGMLLGRVHAVGADYTGPLRGVTPGTPVATLVSLTLTPLHIAAITEIRPKAHQVVIRGHALLPSSAPIAVLPTDISQGLVLSVLDVCGAPALVDRWVRNLPQNGRLMVLGAGKAGVLSLLAAKTRRPDLHLFAVDRDQTPLDAVAAIGLAEQVAVVDASDAVAVRAQAQAWSDGQGMDAVINMASLPGTEMATILATRQRGLCLFFGMATSFTRVALGAEGVGADVDLLIGNGYATDHAEFALNLLRSAPAVQQLLAKRLGV